MADDTTHGERTKADIIAAGLKLWRVDPASVSARRIGKELGMTHGAILYYFDNADAMRDAIAAEAVRLGDAKIVPHLIVSKHVSVAGLSDGARREFLAGC